MAAQNIPILRDVPYEPVQTSHSSKPLPKKRPRLEEEAKKNKIRQHDILFVYLIIYTPIMYL